MSDLRFKIMSMVTWPLSWPFTAFFIVQYLATGRIPTLRQLRPLAFLASGFRRPDPTKEHQLLGTLQLIFGHRLQKIGRRRT